jgi:hypothetical protein
VAWEWVGATSTGLVGVAGIVATWLGGKGQRDTAERLAEQERKERRDSEFRAQRRAVYDEALSRLGRVNFLAGMDSKRGQLVDEYGELMACIRRLQAYAPADTCMAARDVAAELSSAFSEEAEKSAAIKRVEAKFRLLIPVMARDLGHADDDRGV